jgi:protein O-mannosyl-transferase
MITASKASEHLRADAARTAASAQAAPSNPLHRRDLLTIALLFALAVGCYVNTLGNAFVYDDQLQILQNPYVKSWHYLPQIFRTTVWSFIGDAGQTNYYRPLMTLTYLGLWKTFGDLPTGFHLFNILLNALVVACVFYAGRALFRNHWAAALAAAVFALHPVHTETVNWVAAVPDLEATLFFVAAFLVHAGEERTWKTQTLVVVLFVLALLAKEPALMLAPVLVCYEHLVREGHRDTKFPVKFRRYLPVCVAAMGYVALRIALFGKMAPVLQHAQISWQSAIYSAFSLIAEYARLLVWPVRLSAFHVFHASVSLTSPGVLVGMGMVAASIAFVLATYKPWPQGAFCVIWMALTLAPVLNARWMAANVLTERYLYLPSVGFCWLAGWSGLKLWGVFRGDTIDRAHTWNARAAARWAIAVAGVALAFLSATAVWSRNQVWHDDFTLYTQTLKTDPDSYIMHMNLGTSYFAARNFASAERELHRALELRPESTNVLNALGCVYMEQGRLDEAAAALQKAIALKPTWTDPHFNYGRLLEKTGHDAEALLQFRTAVQVGPLNAGARLLLGDQLAKLGDDTEAETEYRKAIELDPSLKAQQDLVHLLIKTGRDAEAMAILRKLVSVYPYDSEAHLKLGGLLEKSGAAAEARKEYQATLETDPANSEAREGLKRLQTTKRDSLPRSE